MRWNRASTIVGSARGAARTARSIACETATSDRFVVSSGRWPDTCSSTRAASTAFGAARAPAHALSRSAIGVLPARYPSARPVVPLMPAPPRVAARGVGVAAVRRRTVHEDRSQITRIGPEIRARIEPGTAMSGEWTPAFGGRRPADTQRGATVTWGRRSRRGVLAGLRPATVRALQHLGHQRRDRAALAAGERDVGEQRVALQLLDHRADAVVPADPQVVPLRDVVGEHHPARRAQPGEHREQHVALQRLRLVDDHERVVQRPPADVGERQDLEQAAGDDLVDDVLADQRTERVEHGLGPRPHLLALAAGQVAEILAADGVERAEHDDLAVLLALQDGLEAGAQRERRLPGAGPAAHRDDPDLVVQQQVQRDPLLRGAPVQPERLAVAAHELDPLVRGHPPERVRPPGEPQPGVAGQVARRVVVDHAVAEQRVHLARR